MEEVILWVFWGIVILGSVVNASLKAKKKREEAAKTARRRAQQYEPNPFPMPELVEDWPILDGRFTSRENIGQELVYEEGRGAQREMVYAEGGRVTKDPAGQGNTAGKGIKERIEAIEAQEKSAGQKPGDGEANPLKEILGGEFDLRRAIIESEIITPKYF